MRKNCSTYRGKRLKLEAEGREFAKHLRSLEQFVRTVKRSEHFLVTECFFNLFLEVSQIRNLEQFQFKLEKIIGI